MCERPWIQAESWTWWGMWSDAVVCPASNMRPVIRHVPVWRYAGEDQFAYPRSIALRPEYWFARPGLWTVCPYVLSPPLTSGDNPTTPAYAAVIVGLLYSLPLRNSAEAVRAMRLASATATSIFSLHAIMRTSHVP